MDGTCTRVAGLAVALAALLACAPAQAATIAAVPGNDATAGCTLREAVTASNDDVAGGGCPAGAGADTIILAAGTYTLSTAGAPDEVNASGDLDITQSVTITGAGPSATTISAGSNDRVFDVKFGIQVSISDVTIRDGQAPHAPSVGTDGASGGGIRSSSPLTLTRVIVTENFAGTGGSGAMAPTGGGGGHGGSGGGIASGALLTIIDSVISNNGAGNGGDGGIGQTTVGGFGGSGGSGGGVAGVTVVISGSTISGNSSGSAGAGGSGPTAGNGGFGGDGGGIQGLNVTISDSVVSNNIAGSGGAGGFDSNGQNTASGGFGGSGGGVFTTISGSLTRVRVTGNRAGNGGSGGLGNGGASGSAGYGGDGGGVRASGTITDSTFAGNVAGTGGFSGTGSAGKGGDAGGVRRGPGSIVIAGTTITGNTAGKGGGSSTAAANGGDGGGVWTSDLTLTNSTVTANTSGAGGDGQAGGGRSGMGGGLYISPGGGGGSLTHATLAGNDVGAGGIPNGSAGIAPGVFAADAVTISSSILTSGQPTMCASANPGLIADGGRNIVFGTQCPDLTTAAAGDPLLAALADNGGPTQTMALGDGSSALDLVPASGAGCLATDQRGTSRPQGSACDSGAFERTVPVPDTGGTGDGGGTGGTTTTDPGTQPTTQTPQPGTTAAADRTGPVVVLRLFRQKLLRALTKGYRTRFTSNELGRAVVELFASGRDARGAQTRRRRVARGTLAITRSGTQTVVARFTKRAKRAFARRKKVTLTLRVAVSDAAGNRTVRTAKVVLRR